MSNSVSVSNSPKKRVSFGALSELVNAEKRLSLSKLKKLYSSPLTSAGKEAKVAMDARLDESGHFSAIERVVASGGIDPFPQFLGYSYLSSLQQNGFIKAGVEGLADDMTESWVELIRKGSADGDADAEQLQKLNAALDTFHVKEVFNRAATLCGYFGGCLVFIDDGTDDKDLASAMDNKSLAGSLKHFTVIEPINVYPGVYNSSNPLRSDYFKPQTWFVLGREVHHSRLLYFSADEVGVLLKPAYNFFGISPAQIAVDSVSHFMKDREAAGRLLHKFSLLIFKTDMGSALYDGNPEELYKRVKLLADFRDNDSVEVIDTEEEDIVQLTTSLTGVSELVRLSLELMPIMFRQPLTKFLGISPGGMNATGESDENNWNQYVLSQCEKVFRTPLQRLIEIVQYHLFGSSDDDIGFVFKKRSSRDEAAKANINKVKADTDAVYVSAGILSPDEIRKRVAADPDSGYNSIDADDIPEPAEAGNEDYDFRGGTEQSVPLPATPSLQGDSSADTSSASLSLGMDDWDPFEADNYAEDAEFNENNIKRKSNGQFGSGSGKSETSESFFGKAYSEFSGKPKEAIDKLLKEKQGHVPAIVTRDGIGKIALPYGEAGTAGTKQGYGLSHLIRRRDDEDGKGEGEKFALNILPKLLTEGIVYSKVDHKDRAYIGSRDHEVAVRLNWDNQENAWIPSGYVRRKKEKGLKPL